ncbi:MAG TPA: carbonic anhydrase [Capsulimonadaceae bacterium]|jgi:hypothetical protein
MTTVDETNVVKIPRPPTEAVFESEIEWYPSRPHILVIACSDGRLQKSLDDFLHENMGVTDYDRLFAPGGPGAFTPDGVEPVRSAQFLQELRFLVRAHGIERIILVFHSAAEGGPVDSICGDYMRLFPGADQKKVADQQSRDLVEVIELISKNFPEVEIQSFRAEVTAKHHVRFVEL